MRQRYWIILKARGGDHDRPWQLWLASGIDRWPVAQRRSHAACINHMDEVVRSYQAAARASEIEWPIGEHVVPGRLDVAGYAPDRRRTDAEIDLSGSAP